MFTLSRRYELGFRFDTAERSRIWLITLPRLGLGYRFGDGVDSVRLIFSFRY